MAKWTKKPYQYTLIGLEYGSKPEPYQVVVAEDTRNGRRWVSCNCPSFTRGRQNKGLQQWERTCKHIERGGYTVNNPEIDFDGRPVGPAQPSPPEPEEDLQVALNALTEELARVLTTHQEVSPPEAAQLLARFQGLQEQVQATVDVLEVQQAQMDILQRQLSIAVGATPNDTA